MRGRFTIKTRRYHDDDKLVVELDGSLEAERVEDLELLRRSGEGTVVEADWIRLRDLQPVSESRPKPSRAKSKGGNGNEKEPRDYH